MPHIPTGTKISTFHDTCLAQPDWPEKSSSEKISGVAGKWIGENHICNCRLWAEEDLARRTQVPDHEIAANKRAIDRFNQDRNDAIERIDEHIIEALGLPLGVQGPDSKLRLNSETAGSIIDRLSIISLKIKSLEFHSKRVDVSGELLKEIEFKLNQMNVQRRDLIHCYDTLILECAEGKAIYRIYRQNKMYNDPLLNPAILAESK